MNEAPDRTIILGLQHWVTRPDLETIFETKMVSNRSRDHFETKMSHYLEWRDWFRDHIRDQNGLNSGLETSTDTKMSHSALKGQDMTPCVKRAPHFGDFTSNPGLRWLLESIKTNWKSYLGIFPKYEGGFWLRYESSTLILYKELSSPIFKVWVRHR